MAKIQAGERRARETATRRKASSKKPSALRRTESIVDRPVVPFSLSEDRLAALRFHAQCINAPLSDTERAIAFGGRRPRVDP